MALRAVAISGSPRTPSKSKTLADALLRALAKHGCETSMIDVAELPAAALLARDQAPAIDAAIEDVGRASIVVAASPTYRALYTGALKCLFDLMPPSHLRAKVCIPVQTGAAAAHFLSVEYGLRPLFASLDGTAIAGIYATDEQFTDGVPSPDLDQRIGHLALAAVTLAAAMRGR